jgi:hypothetical protein
MGCRNVRRCSRGCGGVTGAAHRMGFASQYRAGARLSENRGGDLLVKTIAPRLKDMAISEEMAVEILTEPNGWNSRCEPPWSLGNDVPDADNLAVKVHNGYVYCTQNPPGIDTADAHFAGITDDPRDTAAFVLQMRAQEQKRQRDRGISYQDFVKYLPEDNTYIFIPTGEKWKAQGVATASPPIPVLGLLPVPRTPS